MTIRPYWTVFRSLRTGKLPWAGLITLLEIKSRGQTWDDQCGPRLMSALARGKQATLRQRYYHRHYDRLLRCRRPASRSQPNTLRPPYAGDAWRSSARTASKLGALAQTSNCLAC